MMENGETLQVSLAADFRHRYFFNTLTETSAWVPPEGRRESCGALG